MLINTLSQRKIKILALLKAAILVGALSKAEISKAEAPIDLEIKQTWSLPMREVSGLVASDKLLFLASDHDRDFLQIPLDKGEVKNFDAAKASSFSLKSDKGMKLSKKSQWEGLAIDKDGSLFAIKESKDQIFQFTNDGKAKRVYQLQYFAGRKNKRKGFEGLLPMQKSHFLVALTAPPTLIEYGPKGDKALGVNRETLLQRDASFTPPSSDDLYPLASWVMDSPKKCEMSDLSLSTLGSVIILLKDCFHIVRAPNLDPSKNSFTPEQIWNYPSEIDHAEGLVSKDEGFLVSVDQISESKNLFWLEKKELKKAP